ncbi:unnamed protein product [Arabis nemorensis]|uniref:Cystatin domain-containing protein n=1 Tax=Arabis nemorensis TaxID=586526 RepID=A0A565AWH6_9BRAS|nr:unnamed protein product [Arabis nemorensis]
MDLRKCSTREGESSKLEAMEESPAVAIASVTKRKAEFELEEEESGSEEYGREVYEDEGGKKWRRPEWDVDSFDGLEYRSSEEDVFTDEEEEENWRRYKRLVIGSKGFYVEPGLTAGTIQSTIVGIKPVRDMSTYAGHGETHLEFFEEMSNLCLQKYNQERGLNVEFVQVVRGNFSLGSRSKTYVTFLAKEKPDGPLVEYQAKVWSTFKKGENFPILCRPAPPLPFSIHN